MRARSVLVSLCCVTMQILSCASSIPAYELLTHAYVSREAFDRSTRLKSYADDVGIDSTSIFEFDPDEEARSSARFAGFQNSGTARDWLAAGSIREDDYLPHPLAAALLRCVPPANPQSPNEKIDRPKHHFFDVQRGGGGIANGFPAPDWALGLLGRGPNADQNHFSLADARVHQLRSLTDGTRSDRDRYTARMFRTLGQVIHVLQDMAQPQHTRNDPHVGCTLLRFIAGEKSWYEAYTETRARTVKYKNRTVASRSLVFAGYDPVSLPAYRDYWANPMGSGLAEYSSRNFFSAGTNLGVFNVQEPCGGLSEPVCDPRAYSTEDVSFTVPRLIGPPLIGQLRFYLRDIADPLTGQVDRGVRVSTRSLWDQHLERLGLPRRFTLNTYNYDSMADVLIPRAVGYSAGLLDHFFRGRLDVAVVSDPDDSTNSHLILRGTNASPEPLAAGTISLYYEDPNGNRLPVSTFVPITVTASQPIERNGIISSAPFLAPFDAVRFVAVYHGMLGQEDDVVIAKVLTSGAGVEELFIDNATGDVHLRNRTLLAPLYVLDQLIPQGAYIDRVIWGNDGRSFMVRVWAGPGFDWAIFELSPRPAAKATWLAPPTATLVRQEPFDLSWTRMLGGRADEVTTVVLDSRRDVLYAGMRGLGSDPHNFGVGVLVNQSARTTLLDYGMAMVGEFGGGSVPYLVYADGSDPSGTVAIVKSFAYLDHEVWGVDALTPFLTALWVGDSARVLHADGFGAPRNHELIEHFQLSDDPVWPHSTRRHVLYSVAFRDRDDPQREILIHRIYLHDVQTGLSRVVAENLMDSATPQLDLVARYDFRASANTGVDRLFQASSINTLDNTPLPTAEREQFVVAWDRATGTPTMDVTGGGYPTIDQTATHLLPLTPLPPDRMPRWPENWSRAIQIIE
jgi:hypothetical protein